MGATRKAMKGLCDLNGAKLLRSMRAGVLLNQRRDGQYDGNEPLGPDLGDTKAGQRDPGSALRRHAAQARGYLRRASFFEEQRNAVERLLDEPIRFRPEPDV